MLKDPVTVATYGGESAYGPAYEAARTVRVNVDATRRLVRNATGDEVVSETTLTAHPATRDAATGELLDALTLFAPESKVTIAGREARVISTKADTVRGQTVAVQVTTT